MGMYAYNHFGVYVEVKAAGDDMYGDFMEATDWEHEEAFMCPEGCEAFENNLNVMYLIPNAIPGPHHEKIYRALSLDDGACEISADLINQLHTEAVSNAKITAAVLALGEHFGSKNVRMKVGLVKYYM